MSAEPIARDRILDSAYDLFSRRGIRAVGIEEVIERAAVAKATLYRHFPSKDDLVLAFLRKREEVWTHGWVEIEARRRGVTPEESLLAIFDLFDEWFHRSDFEGCSFVNVLLLMPFVATLIGLLGLFLWLPNRLANDLTPRTVVAAPVPPGTPGTTTIQTR